MASKRDDGSTLVAENRKARHEYFITDSWEAGIALLGSEVKSLRVGQSNITESYASFEDGGLWLINAYIAEYKGAALFQHEPRRKRKLLLHAGELKKMKLAIERKGMTLVPLELYFNAKGIAKLKIGLAEGKKLHDKREDAAKRDWNRQKARLMPLFDVMFIETNPGPVKYAVSRLGLCTSEMRLPMVPISDQSKRAIDAVMADLGLIDAKAAE